MSQNIATLAVKFIADTAGLKAGTHEASGYVDALGKNLGKTAGKLGLGGVLSEVDEVAGAFMELGPAGGIAALGFVAINAAIELGHAAFEQFLASSERIEKNNRLAERLDTTYASIQSLSFAAQRSGQDMDTVAKAMEHMAKVSISARDAAHRHTQSLGKLTKSGRETADAFGKLGRSTDKLEGKDLEEQFIIQAKRIGELKDPVLRASEVLRVFGKSAGPLVPMLKHLGENMERSRKYAERFGFAIDDVDANNIERMNSAWGDLVYIGSQLADKFVSKFGGPMAATLEILISRTMEWAGHLEKLGFTWDDVGSTAIKGMLFINNALGFANSQLKLMVGHWEQIYGLQKTIAALVTRNVEDSRAGLDLVKHGKELARAGAQERNDFFSGKMSLDFLRQLKKGTDFSLRGGFHGGAAEDMLGGPEKFPKALTRGSAGAISAVLEAGGNPLGSIAENTKEMLESLKEIYHVLIKSGETAPVKIDLVLEPTR